MDPITPESFGMGSPHIEQNVRWELSIKWNDIAEGVHTERFLPAIYFYWPNRHKTSRPKNKK